MLLVEGFCSSGKFLGMSMLIHLYNILDNNFGTIRWSMLDTDLVGYIYLITPISYYIKFVID